MQPNFFIVGGPKCGTTAMHNYLQTHPQIFVPELIKEPHHFSPEFWSLDAFSSREKYLKLFQEANEQHLAIGESSTGYIISDVALERIREFNPKSKIVLMLRNPVEMADSLYGEMRYAWVETCNDFEAAWGMQEERRRLGPPRIATPTDLRLQYSRCCSVGSHYQKALKVFAPEQVKVILLDDLHRDTRGVYLELLEFLGVPDDGRVEFPAVNVRKQHKFPALMKFFMKPPEPFYTWKKWVRNQLGLQSSGWGTWLISYFAQPIKKSPLRLEFAEELYRHFTPEVEILEQLLHRRLDHWKASSATSKHAA